MAIFFDAAIPGIMQYSKKWEMTTFYAYLQHLINNMVHMRVSDNEPSSVILSQRKLFQKLKMMVRKCQNKLKSKRMV